MTETPVYPPYIMICLDSEINELQHNFTNEEYNSSTNCWFDGIKKIIPQLFVDKPDIKQIQVDIADLIVKCFDIITIKDPKRLKHQLEIFWYDLTQGIWRESGVMLIGDLIRRIMPKAKMVEINEIIDKIKTNPKTFKDRSILNSKKCLVVANGVVDFEERDKDGDFVIYPHMKDFYATNRLNIIHKPMPAERCCPNIVAHLKAIFETKLDVQTFIETVAYFLYPDYHINSLHFWTGITGSGKSTTIKIIYEFLGGSPNISAVSLRALAYEKFAISELFGKMVNFAAERGGRKAIESDNLKKITGNDPLEENVKNFRYLSFVNRNKIVCICNETPKMQKDDAMIRRMVITPFAHKFTKKEKKRQHEWLAKCTTDEEFSGFLNLCLIALKRLIERNDFLSKYETEEEKWEDYQDRSKTSVEVIAEQTRPEENYYTTGGELHLAYLMKVEERKESVKLSPRKFLTDFRIAYNELHQPNTLPASESIKIKGTNKQVRGYKDVLFSKFEKTYR